MTPDPLLEDLSRTLNTPLLQLGEIAITPLFLIKAAVFMVALFVIAAFVRRRLVFRVLARSNVDDGVKYATARIAGYLVWIFGLMAGLPLLGIRLSSILVAFGAVGIGIGLGLQKIADDKVVRFNFPVGVSYDADPDRVRECLLEVAAGHPEVLKSPEPTVFFLGFGESSLDFKLCVYSTSMVHLPEVLTSEIYFAIWYRLKAANITIPFPQRDLHLKSVAPEIGRLAG